MNENTVKVVGIAAVAALTVGFEWMLIKLTKMGLGHN